MANELELRPGTTPVKAEEERLPAVVTAEVGPARTPFKRAEPRRAEPKFVGEMETPETKWRQKGFEARQREQRQRFEERRREKEKKPSFKERVRTRYETIRHERAIAKTPEARAKRIGERKESLKLGKEELDLRKGEREQRFRRVTESRLGYTTGVAFQVTRPAAVAFRRAERRGIRIDPRTAYGPGLTGISAQQRFGPPRPGLAAPQIQPSVGLPIHSMGSISTGGIVSRFEPERAPRQAIPRGTIKSYWSKKVKSLAKANVRKYGPDEGIARTKQLAEELGWKMQ